MNKSNQLTRYSPRRLYLIILLSLLVGIVACQQNPSQARYSIDHSQALSVACERVLGKTIVLYQQQNFDQALAQLILSRRAACVSQYELARVEHFQSTLFFELNDTQRSLESISAAVRRDVLEERLQKESLYLAAQLSYLQMAYTDTLEFLDLYEELARDVMPSVQVLRARSHYALGANDLAMQLMLDLYVRYRNGEIEMQEDWLDFFRGLQVGSASLTG